MCCWVFCTFRDYGPSTTAGSACCSRNWRLPPDLFRAEKQCRRSGRFLPRWVLAQYCREWGSWSRSCSQTGPGKNSNRPMGAVATKHRHTSCAEDYRKKNSVPVVSKQSQDALPRLGWQPKIYLSELKFLLRKCRLVNAFYYSWDFCYCNLSTTDWNCIVCSGCISGLNLYSCHFGIWSSGAGSQPKATRPSKKKTWHSVTYGPFSPQTGERQLWRNGRDIKCTAY